MIDYLSMCDIESIKNNSFYYAGFFDTKLYSLWESTDALILFVEGLNQFAVKLVKNFSKENNFDDKILPAQIKNLIFHEKPGYDRYSVRSDFQKVGKSYIVNCSAYSMNSDGVMTLVSESTIYLSCVEAEEVEND